MRVRACVRVCVCACVHVYHVARLVRVRREQDVVALADRVALHHVLQLVHPVLRVVRIQRALHDPEHLELLAEPKEYNTKKRRH